MKPKSGDKGALPQDPENPGNQTNAVASQAEVVIQHKDQRQIFGIRPGLGLSALCAKNNTPIEFDCRRADCGICIIQVREGMENLNPKTEAEADFLRAMHAEDSERLACQTRVMKGRCVLEVEF